MRINLVQRVLKKVHRLPDKSKTLRYYVQQSAEVAKQTLHTDDDLTIDEFRHGWTSANLTYKYGSTITRILSGLNEYISILCPLEHTNMDLWNNNVGIQIGKAAKKAKLSRDKLAEKVKEAIDNKLLIANPYTDTREYQSRTFSLFKYFLKKCNIAKYR